jgi:hypothetical protein
MRMLLIGITLLFTNGFVNNYEAYGAQHKAYGQPQHGQWHVAAFAIGEESIRYEERDPYDPRDDCLYRLYLAATVLGVVGGIIGVSLLFWQTSLLRLTVEDSSEQSKAMQLHIGEATRSADAMEDISEVIQKGNAAIIRAYLSVVIGTAAPQNRKDNVKFEAKPLLVNSGNTPARNVKIRISAEIIPNGKTESFTYAVPNELAKAAAVAAPHQNYTLSAIVKDFVPDADVPDIKDGGKGVLAVWGLVTYDDIFGDSHTTKFGQFLFWYPNQTVFGFYIGGQNDMD